ncbi:hypothetical protein [Aeribacillus alveayuensis]
MKQIAKTIKPTAFVVVIDALEILGKDLIQLKLGYNIVVFHFFRRNVR